MCGEDALDDCASEPPRNPLTYLQAPDWPVHYFSMVSSRIGVVGTVSCKDIWGGTDVRFRPSLGFVYAKSNEDSY